MASGAGFFKLSVALDQFSRRHEFFEYAFGRNAPRKCARFQSGHDGRKQQAPCVDARCPTLPDARTWLTQKTFGVATRRQIKRQKIAARFQGYASDPHMSSVPALRPFRDLPRRARQELQLAINNFARSRNIQKILPLSSRVCIDLTNGLGTRHVVVPCVRVSFLKARLENFVAQILVLSF